MKDIPVDARVECADGPCGKSLGVIAEPGTRKLTHFVVEDETLPYPPYQRLVPIEHVIETTRDLIRLGCTKAEVGDMDPFVRTRYIQKKKQDYSLFEGGEGPSDNASTVMGAYTKKQETLIPEGELGVSVGTRVEATDGHIGHVGELLADEDTGQLTHLVLEEGHLWGKKEVTLPASAVDRVEGDTMYLNLDKSAVQSLPAVRVKRRRKR